MCKKPKKWKSLYWSQASSGNKYCSIYIYFSHFTYEHTGIQQYQGSDFDNRGWLTYNRGLNTSNT